MFHNISKPSSLRVKGHWKFQGMGGFKSPPPPPKKKTTNKTNYYTKNVCDWLWIISKKKEKEKQLKQHVVYNYISLLNNVPCTCIKKVFPRYHACYHRLYNNNLWFLHFLGFSGFILTGINNYFKIEVGLSPQKGLGLPPDGKAVYCSKKSEYTTGVILTL